MSHSELCQRACDVWTGSREDSNTRPLLLDLALNASEDHRLEKLVKRAEESDRPVALRTFWIFSWLQQCDYFCFPPFVWYLLLFKTVMARSQSGWSEAFAFALLL